MSLLMQELLHRSRRLLPADWKRLCAGVAAAPCIYSSQLMCTRASECSLAPNCCFHGNLDTGDLATQSAGVPSSPVCVHRILHEADEDRGSRWNSLPGQQPGKQAACQLQHGSSPSQVCSGCRTNGKTFLVYPRFSMNKPALSHSSSQACPEARGAVKA